jgi:hypothetical protein
MIWGITQLKAMAKIKERNILLLAYKDELESRSLFFNVKIAVFFGPVLSNKSADINCLFGADLIDVP